jgi:hypothetical protein
VEGKLKAAFTERFGSPVEGYEYFTGDALEMYALFEFTTVGYIAVRSFDGPIDVEKIYKTGKSTWKWDGNPKDLEPDPETGGFQCFRCGKPCPKKERLKQHLTKQTTDCLEKLKFRESLKDLKCPYKCKDKIYKNGYIRNTHMKKCDLRPKD